LKGKEMYRLFLISVISIFMVTSAQPVCAKGGGDWAGSRKNQQKPSWSATEWQKRLPAIVVEEKGKTKKYSFINLIEADGYLCPGSARAYKTLQVALPLLYKDTMPVKGDFQIIYGDSDCATKVYKYFMGKYKKKEYLTLDKSMKGMECIIIRKSTGMKVRTTFDPPAHNRHNAKGAKAGDVILKAKNGAGMKVESL
jgi:hypothetical protein